MRLKARPLSTDEQIAAYIKVYFSVEGKIPKAIKAGAWIHIATEDGVKTVRKKDIPKMILELQKKDLERKPHVDDYFMIDGSWYRIKKDIVNQFFERLYENCNHSVLKMEECLMDYALSNSLTYGLNPNNNDGFRDNCDGCDKLYDANYEAEDLSVKVEDLEKENQQLSNELDSLTNISVQRENHWKKEVDRLKEESVLFSMDDFEFEEFEPEEDIFDTKKPKQKTLGDALLRSLQRQRRRDDEYEDIPF